MVEARIWRSSAKIGLLTSHLLGHSGSLEPTQIDPHDFLLTIHALRHIWPVITDEVAITIACSFVTSCLVYANSVLYGISAKNIHRLQRMRNALAQVVLGSSVFKIPWAYLAP